MPQINRIFSATLLIIAFLFSPSVFAAGFSPFIQIATVPAVWKDGKVDHVATYTRAADVAFKIAAFVAKKDESTLGLSESNWVLGGAPEGATVKDADVKAAILDVPTNQPINPSVAYSVTNTKKINIIELCNQVFASKALGITPVVGTTRVANGHLHATALPCEVAVYADGYDIKIEMLNAEAIFSLFFTDVLFGKQMQNQAFATAIQKLPVQVNTELPAIIYQALTDAKVTYWADNWSKGPWFSDEWDMVRALLSTPMNSPYVHFTYSKVDGKIFSDDEVLTVAKTIIATLTVNGTTGAGVHDAALDAQLSTGSQWRSARPAPLSLPGGIKLIEGCSPMYAKQALTTGFYHATALPCEMAVMKSADSKQLLISFLDPHFMFNALFSDAFDNMTAEQLTAFATLPDIVLDDLQIIVDYALDVNLPKTGIKLMPPVSFYYDMLPF
ncbi:hypothetical protein [Chromatium okenii]|uniref:hypothetical protein n=1 Tax=Chromatium okenii TaxID=61644 RepID=UPI0026F0CABD|nr:hypothetical protein [Chromatium okenii]